MLMVAASGVDRQRVGGPVLMIGLSRSRRPAPPENKVPP